MKVFFVKEDQKDTLISKLKEVSKLLPYFNSEGSQYDYDNLKVDDHWDGLTEDLKSSIGPGGRHCIFTSRLSRENLIIKPYRLSFFEIVHYYYTMQVMEEMGETRIILPQIHAIGFFSINEKIIPFVIQEYIEYTRPEENGKDSAKIDRIKAIFRSLINEGFVLDPYVGNFAITDEGIYYTDLIFVVSKSDKIRSRALEEEILRQSELVYI